MPQVEGEKKQALSDEEIAEMVNTGKGLEGWKPTSADLMGLMSNQRVPLDRAWEVVKEKAKNIMPLADQETMNVTFTE